MTNSKGSLLPGANPTEISVSFVQQVVKLIDENLTIKTDLHNSNYLVNVKGRSEEALLHLEEFQQQTFGMCPILKAASLTFSIRNYGHFPLTFDAKYSYPIKLQPTSGIIKDMNSLEFYATWVPQGAFDLRSVVQLITNIGNFDIIIRGKSLIPDLKIQTSLIHFGYCGMGYEYVEYIVFLNSGKVPLSWHIPDIPEGFSFDRSKGDLLPKEETKVGVKFIPTEVGKKSASLSIECRGTPCKEISLDAICGTFGMTLGPLDLTYKCRCNDVVGRMIFLKNTGDIPVKIEFETTSFENCSVRVPDLVTVAVKQELSITIFVKSFKEGPFSAKVKAKTREKDYEISLSGESLAISLSKTSKDILENDRNLFKTEYSPIFEVPNTTNYFGRIIDKIRIDKISEISEIEKIQSLVLQKQYQKTKSRVDVLLQVITAEPIYDENDNLHKVLEFISFQEIDFSYLLGRPPAILNKN